MTNLTLVGWQQTVAIGLIGTIPLQDFDSALILSQNYVSSVGGWTPDDPLDSTGPGVPVSGDTTSEGITIITQQQKDRVYHVAIAGTVNFTYNHNENLPIGLSDNDVLLNITAGLSTVIQSNLNNTNLTFVDVPTFTGVITSGPTTAAIRLGFFNSINAGGIHTDPNIIGLITAQSKFGLDTNYNVEYLYTETNKNIAIVVRKYTNTTFSTLDNTATSAYAITLEPTGFKLINGTIFTV